MIEDVLMTYEFLLQKHDIQLTKSLEKDLRILVDEAALQTILRNLISNAIKFTPKNGSIEIITAFVADKVNIIIKDTGIGMSTEKQKQLFSKNTIRRSKGLHGEQGSRLGLHLVSEFTKVNDGTIKVESQEGIGSTFVLEFPSTSFEVKEIPNSKEISTEAVIS